MTTEDVPHTPTLWRRVLSLPHTRLGWLAIGLGVPSLVLIVFVFVLMSPSPVGTAILLTAFFVGLPGGILGLIAVGAGERSWLVLVAQGAAMPVFAFFVGIAISMWGGGGGWYAEPDMRVVFPIAVLLWAVIDLGIMLVSGIFRKTRESG